MAAREAEVFATTFALLLAFEPPPPATTLATGGLVLRLDADTAAALDTPVEGPAFELERVTLDPEAAEPDFADFGAISNAIDQTGKQIRNLARKDRQISVTKQETRK